MDTYKLIFPTDTTEQEVRAKLTPYLKEDLVMHNFRQNAVIGGNKITYAVVDLPLEIVKTIISEGVAQVDGMRAFAPRPSCAGECESC